MLLAHRELALVWIFWFTTLAVTLYAIISLHYHVYTVGCTRWSQMTVTDMLHCLRFILRSYDVVYTVSEKDCTLFLIFFFRCPVCGEWCKLH